MNEHIRNNKYFATAKEFRDKTDEFFTQTLPQIGDILGSRINDNVQILKHVSGGVMSIYLVYYGIEGSTPKSRISQSIT